MSNPFSARRVATRMAAGMAGLSPVGSAWHEAVTRCFHWLCFVYRHRRFPGDAGAGFNDFLYALKTGGALHDEKRRRVTCKAHCKTYIEGVLGAGRTLPTLAVLGTTVEAAAFLPASFPVVLKPTHSSGRVRIAEDIGSYWKLFGLIKRWFRHDYYQQTLEANYAGLAPAIIVEPYLDTSFHLEGSAHCRGGSVRVISMIDRFAEDKRRASFDREWNHLHVALGQPYEPLEVPRPAWLDQLIQDAEALAAPFEYIRVDFYASDAGYLFGELTNLPGGGLSRFSSPDGEKRFNEAFFGTA